MVAPDGAALIGISGHAVASIPGASEVNSQGERGPYTVVAYEGRNGYVLTDKLVPREQMMAVSSEAVNELVSDSGSSHRLATRGLLIVAGFAASSGIAASMYAFI